MRYAPAIVLTALAVAACAMPPPPQYTPSAAMQEWTRQTLDQRAAEARASNAEADDVAARYAALIPPKDYKNRVDAKLKAILKDPDSRKVEWLPNRGDIVCGTVNSKNSYGGYVGAQPFAAVLESDGTVSTLRIYNTWRNYYSWDVKERAGAQACGFRK